MGIPEQGLHMLLRRRWPIPTTAMAQADEISDNDNVGVIPGRRRVAEMGRLTHFRAMALFALLVLSAPACLAQKIKSVVWEEGPYSTLESYAGGYRIFPGAEGPNDAHVWDRRVLFATATVRPAGSGVRVFFGKFDMDDPSDDTRIDPNGDDGGDNRSESFPYAHNVASAVTDSEGKARMLVEAPMSPGDNIVIVADLDSALISELFINPEEVWDGTADDDPPATQTTTQTLTTWRRLHIELDSMEGPDYAASNPYGSNILPSYMPTYLYPGENPACTEVLPGIDYSIYYPEWGAENAHFENGLLLYPPMYFPQGVISLFGSTYRSPGEDPLLYLGDIRQILPNYVLWNYIPFEAVDDDGVFTNTLPRLASTSSLASALSPCYIQPVFYSSAPYSQMDLPLKINLSLSDALAYGDTYRDLDGSPEFWVAWVCSAFQPEPDSDGDPDDSFATTVADAVGQDPKQPYVFVYQEIVQNEPFIADLPGSEGLRVAHEIGHVLMQEPSPDINEHWPGSLMSPEGTGDGELPPEAINKMRGRTQSPEDGY